MRTWTGWIVVLLALAAPASAQEGKGGSADGGPGTLVVQNRLDEAVVVWVNGEMRGAVDPGGEGRFGGVPSGRLDVQAGVSGGGPVASEQRQLDAGETFTWTLYPVPVAGEEKGTGTIVLQNALEREVEVYLGETTVGSLAPGATRAMARIVAGEVTAVAREGEEVLAERRLAVEPGQVTRWEIGGAPPPTRRAAVRRDEPARR